ncbi:MAG: hypothetical protein RXS42_00765 [Nitrososphaeria archaeon]
MQRAEVSSMEHTSWYSQSSHEVSRPQSMQRNSNSTGAPPRAPEIARRMRCRSAPRGIRNPLPPS